LLSGRGGSPVEGAVLEKGGAGARATYATLSPARQDRPTGPALRAIPAAVLLERRRVRGEGAVKRRGGRPQGLPPRSIPLTGRTRHPARFPSHTASPPVRLRP